MDKYITNANQFIKDNITHLFQTNQVLQVSPDRYTFFVRTDSVCSARESEIETQIKEDLKIENNKDVSIYVHFPACRYVCIFCHYPKKKNGTELIQMSVDLLAKEIDIFLKKYPKIKKKQITSFYIGGGTPSLMDKGQLKQIFTAFNGCKFSDNCEKTIEGTPDTLSDEKIKDITELGFNRISMGIQILDDDSLNSYQRGHKSKDSINALDLLLKQSNIKTNVDLIYGFPKQTPKKLMEDIKTIIEIKRGPSSITLYRLRLTRIGDEETELMKKYKENSTDFPSQEETYKMKFAASKFLEAKGYVEGPIGWFHKKDEPIVVYKDRWQKQIPLFGFGWKAYSYSQNIQYQNEGDFERYQDNIISGKKPSFRGNIFTQEDKLKRKLAFFLKYGDKFDLLKEEEFIKISKIINQLIEKQFIMVKDNDNKKSIAITETGKIFVEEIINLYIPYENEK